VLSALHLTKHVNSVLRRPLQQRDSCQGQMEQIGGIGLADRRCTSKKNRD